MGLLQQNRESFWDLGKMLEEEDPYMYVCMYVCIREWSLGELWVDYGWLQAGFKSTVIVNCKYHVEDNKTSWKKFVIIFLGLYIIF